MNPDSSATLPGAEAKPAGAVWRAYAGVTSGPVDEKELIERFIPLVRNVVDRIKLTLPPHIDAQKVVAAIEFHW